MIYRRRIVLEGIREPKPLCLGHTGDSKKGHLRAVYRADSRHKNADAPIRSLVKFETPPLEINFLRKASSLLGNVFRASAHSEARGLRIMVESNLSLASVLA